MSDESTPGNVASPGQIALDHLPDEIKALIVSAREKRNDPKAASLVRFFYPNTDLQDPLGAELMNAIEGMATASEIATHMQARMPDDYDPESTDPDFLYWGAYTDAIDDMLKYAQLRLVKAINAYLA